MSDSARNSRTTQNDESLDFTQSIKKLTLPADSGSTATGIEDENGSALLICRDGNSKKWGPRWLKQAGLRTSVSTNSKLAIAEVKDINPDVVVVEASMPGSSGEPLYAQIISAHDISAPVIVLCSNSKETFGALNANAFDVVRKPIEWQLVGLRAQHAATIRQNAILIEKARVSAEKAVEIADLARQQLRSRETFEPVTGLPNKTKFIDLLKRGMMAVDRDENVLAVFVIGFNRFRLVIEAMGQERANLVMTEIGKNLGTCLHAAETAQSKTTGLRTAAAASIELAKFGLMFTCSGDDDAVQQLQQKVVEILSNPVQVAGQTVHLSACVGVALYPQDASDVDQLLQRADNAMRDAQSRGGGYRFYCQETDAAAARKLMLENMLHEALDRNELVVTYQPINRLDNGQIFGGEALLRWQQTDGTFIPPGEFVPIAEDSGLMPRIGKFVLNDVCQQLEIWQKSGLPLEQMCVNVSKAQLMSGDFVRTVARVLEQYDVCPNHLELELSERGVLSGQFDVINQLHDLKDLGVRLSIDDFGTGDSAISYLRELPVDSLKIDRSYVEGLTKSDKDAALVSAMIALGQKLDLTVIAEGVESMHQADMLRELGCDAFQGFYVSEPLSGPKFADLLEKSTLRRS